MPTSYSEAEALPRSWAAQRSRLIRWRHRPIKLPRFVYGILVFPYRCPEFLERANERIPGGESRDFWSFALHASEIRFWLFDTDPKQRSARDPFPDPSRHFPPTDIELSHF